MAPDQELIKLYSKRILALAADIPRAERLKSPAASARKRSPLCGSTVTVDLEIREGRIAEFGQDVKACALGQASSSVIAANALGTDISQIRRARDELSDMLRAKGPPPSAPFDGLEALLPARDYKNRHASIMLCIEATLEAFEKALAQNPG